MIIKLALKDILHDWLLSACLVLAVASIIAPLLILFGLKSGTIHTMRGRLVQDPKNREIRPVSSHSFTRHWFDQVRTAHPEISFIIPMTRQISTTITAVSGAGRKSRLSLMATGADDPLLVENGAAIPNAGECILTKAAAKSLGVKVGETLTFNAGRIMHGSHENGAFTVLLKGILDARASGLKAAFVRLNVLEAVEDFKDGRAVPAYGWQGALPTAYPIYDGVMVLTPQPLTRLEQIMLINNTGFSNQQPLSADQARETLRFTPSPTWNIYRISVKKRPVDNESVLAVRHRLRGKKAIVLPWIRPLAISLSSGEQRKPVRFKLFAVAQKATRAGPAETDFLPWEAGVDLVYAGSQEGERQQMQLTVSTAGRSLSMPVVARAAPLQPGCAVASAALAGRLNLLRRRNIVYDKKTGKLLLSRRGYAGFRMYTTTIDQVETVQDALQQEGITVHTQQQRIAEVRRLDRYLSLIFWLIATVGVIGGIAALTASLYASVERKKRELNTLRLLGLQKRQIVFFPVVQGLMLSTSGLILAGLVFWAVARVIDHLFSSHLRAAESLCTLSVVQVAVLVAGLGACSILSATLAALQAIRLDPAEALRDE